MDCYLSEAERLNKHKRLPLDYDGLPASAIQPLLTFFRIPEERWPPGTRMAARLLAQKCGSPEDMRRLMAKAVKVGASPLKLSAKLVR